MTETRKKNLLRSLRYWGASFAVVAGFIYFQTNASLGAVLTAGLLTFVVTVGRAWMKSEEQIRIEGEYLLK